MAGAPCRTAHCVRGKGCVRTEPAKHKHALLSVHAHLHAQVSVTTFAQKADNHTLVTTARLGGS
eukprot:366399-Chlamydomonas_euryale.AAC.49